MIKIRKFNIEIELLYNIQSTLKFYLLSHLMSFIAIFFAIPDHILPLAVISLFLKNFKLN